MKVERRSPWRNPREVKKFGVGLPLIRIEKKTVHKHCMIQDINIVEKPITVMTALR